jgi:two-component sensor histidine kinase
VHRTAKNLLAIVQATVQLTQAHTVKEFKAAIEGRLRALSNAHTLLAQSCWAGVDRRSLVMEGLAPYGAAKKSRADISGPTLGLRAKIRAVDRDGCPRIDSERGQVWGSLGFFGSA